MYTIISSMPSEEKETILQLNLEEESRLYIIIAESVPQVIPDTDGQNHENDEIFQFMVDKIMLDDVQEANNEMFSPETLYPFLPNLDWDKFIDCYFADLATIGSTVGLTENGAFERSSSRIVFKIQTLMEQLNCKYPVADWCYSGFSQHWLPLHDEQQRSQSFCPNQQYSLVVVSVIHIFTIL